MKLAALLAIVLFMGVVTSTIVTTSTYSDSDCKNLISTAATVEFKSGTCVSVGTASTRIKVSGDKVETCAYSDNTECKGSGTCVSIKNGQCMSNGDGTYDKVEFVGSSSSVAFSSLFIVAAVVVALVL